MILKICLFIFENPQLSEHFKSTLMLHINIDMCLTDVLGIIGKVDFTVRHLSSSTSSFPSTWEFNSGQQCIGNTHQVCCFSLFLTKSQYIFALTSIFLPFLILIFSLVLKTVFCIHFQSCIRENVDHAYYLSRICCCSCHYSWICAFCCKLIHNLICYLGSL